MMSPRVVAAVFEPFHMQRRKISCGYVNVNVFEASGEVPRKAPKYDTSHMYSFPRSKELFGTTLIFSAPVKTQEAGRGGMEGGGRIGSKAELG